MLFSSTRNPLKNVPLDISQLDNLSTIEQTDEFKYPGIWLDTPMSFKTLIDKVCDKLRSRTGILWFIRSYVMLRYVMLCYVMLCYVMLCYVMTDPKSNQFYRL